MIALTPTMRHVADECREIRLSGAMIPIWQLREIWETSATGFERLAFAGDTTQEAECNSEMSNSATLCRETQRIGSLLGPHT